MAGPSQNTISIRHATPADIEKLGAIETSAAALFRQAAGLEWIAEDEPMSPALIQARAAVNHVWVAEARGGVLVGYAVVDPRDGCFFITEISVHAAWQRMGIASQIMTALEMQGKEEGFEYASLTTYTHLPWNAPFYRSRGFVEVPREEAGTETLRELEEEGKHGHDVSKRCIMRKQL